MFKYASIMIIGNRLFYFQTKQRVYVCTLATAYTVWASKQKFEPHSLHMIISKRIYNIKFNLFLSYPPFSFFHKCLYFILPRLWMYRL